MTDFTLWDIHPQRVQGTYIRGTIPTNNLETSHPHPQTQQRPHTLGHTPSDRIVLISCNTHLTNRSEYLYPQKTTTKKAQKYNNQGNISTKSSETSYLGTYTTNRSESSHTGTYTHKEIRALTSKGIIPKNRSETLYIWHTPKKRDLTSCDIQWQTDQRSHTLRYIPSSRSETLYHWTYTHNRAKTSCPGHIHPNRSENSHPGIYTHNQIRNLSSWETNTQTDQRDIITWDTHSKSSDTSHPGIYTHEQRRHILQHSVTVMSGIPHIWDVHPQRA